MKQLLSDAIDDYLAMRQAALVRGSVNNEKTVMRRLLASAGNIYCDALSERHIIRYFEVAGKTRSANSLRQDHNTLDLFLRWARQTRRMPEKSDPMYGMRRPRLTRREMGRLHVSQFDHLLSVAGEKDPRDRMLVALFLYTLTRDREATGIRIGDVSLADQSILIRVSKGHDEDRMPISSELDYELRQWLTHYTVTIGRPLEPYDYLIPTRWSVGIMRSGNGKILGHEMKYLPHKQMGPSNKMITPLLREIGFQVSDAAGKPLHEGAHTLRRSGARALFDRLAAEGYDRSLRIVQDMLHHKSLEQTERYIGVTADRRTRDELLKGKPMYLAEVVDLKQRLA